MYGDWRRGADANLGKENHRNLTRKSKVQIRFVVSMFIKFTQIGQGDTGGFKNKTNGLIKEGHKSKFTSAVDDRGQVVCLLPYPGQYAETTSTKKPLLFLASTMVCVQY
jgi:hypothetical protein